MPLTVSQVLGSRPEALVSAAGEVKAAGSEIDLQLAGERSQMDALASKWTGTASDGARVNADEMFGDQQLYRTKLQKLSDKMAASGETLTGIRKELSDLVNSGEAQYFNIADNGSVTAGWRLLWWAALSPRNALEVKIRQLKLQTRIQTALDKFDAADKATAAALRKIGRG
ncbi:WXG100 family type VII secretion target [Mycobacterium sp. DL99]|uniref:WXG100 family type VII secretion target n=1 Tax=Mycobacterium sp. DL99 TaxID=2528957 RepID=UPI00143691CA|nr:WXG100 family type VII secretion target [Mycobacterium sp. DL99]